MKELNYLIMKLNIQKKDFAKEIGTSPGHLTKLLKGEGNLTMEQIEKIAKVYQVNLNWLITGKGEMFNSENKDYLTVNETMAKYGVYETTEKTLLISQIKEKEPNLVLDGVNFVGLQVIYKLILSCESKIHQEKLKYIEDLFQKQLNK